ncbi:MAG TPA: YihY/virulence factor BrkB family protein [Holophaga sp.]|nr:YihY/virulence factor BrkB family protein [Holophaga sp.]
MLQAVEDRARALANRLIKGWLRLIHRIPPLQFAWEVVRKFHRDDCLSYAASVSFFLTISLIPLATLFFKLMTVVLGSGAAYSLRLQRAILEMYPFLPDNFIRNTIAQTRRIDEWSIAWIVLLVGGNWGVTQLDRSLSHIFGLRAKRHRQTRRHYFLRRFGVVLAGLAFVVILLSAGFEWSLRRHAMLPPSAAITLLPALLGLLLITIILQHLPRRHVAFRHAFFGASVTTVLWWGAKGLFGLYYERARELTWGILYGSLGSMMAALLFLYYSCCIFLLGAEVTAAFYRHGTVPARGGRPKSDQSESRP